MVPTTPGFQVPPTHDATLLPRRLDDLARARRRGAGAGSTGSDIGRPVRRRAPHAAQPRLRVGHRRRRQPQRDRSTCQFRAVGETAWRAALPLVRIGGENSLPAARESRLHRARTASPAASSISSPAPSTSAGSRSPIPTASTGEPTTTVRVRTRIEPQPFTGGRTLHVYPPDHQGPKEEPSFTSLLQAYYGAGLGDWSVVWERPAQPGDTILVHAGLYKPERLNYVDPHDDAVRRHDVADARRAPPRSRSRSRRPATAR